MSLKRSVKADVLHFFISFLFSPRLLTNPKGDHRGNPGVSTSAPPSQSHSVFVLLFSVTLHVRNRLPFPFLLFPAFF